MSGLTQTELAALSSKIGRAPNTVESSIVAAEWSEHCSYKSSKKHLSMLPRIGEHLINDPTYDSGVLDVGDGYVITVHIESHNHPSAVEPFGGAATGVGGVIRDILSTGTRPIALLDGLRFGNIESDSHARWLFRGAISGIAHYGNCIGVPTVGGELGFDSCYSEYALVDVAAIGFGLKTRLIQNHAESGDAVMLIGGSTGRDGIGGSQFASDTLETDDTSAVQIPDPFTEKLVIEAILEARDAGLFHALKDLGGGGLSCATSEISDTLGIGMSLDIKRVHTREQLESYEIMTSESQERMLGIIAPDSVPQMQKICAKYNIGCSHIGTVKDGGELHVHDSGVDIARMPTSVVANAPLLDLPTRRPAYLDALASTPAPEPRQDDNYTESLRSLLGSPNIASAEHVYSKYDHEVGIRTVLRPGHDASLLRLDNGKYVSLSIDGNPNHCYVDPRAGAAGCFEEACRNVVCVGAKPIGMVDHLQFGSPQDPEIFWTFMESLHGISEYAAAMSIPCVGGKVSFYNETKSGPIKPTPVIGIVGLADSTLHESTITDGTILMVIGTTYGEMGGSEYHSRIHKTAAGLCPQVNVTSSKAGMDTLIALHDKQLVKTAHDCSKGGLGIAIAEICIRAERGCSVALDNAPGCTSLRTDVVLYSESHSRYVLALDGADLQQALDIASQKGAACAIIGKFGSSDIVFNFHGKTVATIALDDASKIWHTSLERIAYG